MGELFDKVYPELDKILKEVELLERLTKTKKKGLEVTLLQDIASTIQRCCKDIRSEVSLENYK